MIPIPERSAKSIYVAFDILIGMFIVLGPFRHNIVNDEMLANTFDPNVIGVLPKKVIFVRDVHD